MPDPLQEANYVPTVIPSNVKKVKLVISSKKRKLASSVELESVSQLKEVDPNSLESGSSKGVLPAFKKRKHTNHVLLTSLTR